MSRTFHHGERRIRVRGETKDPDLRRFARICIDLANAQAEVEAMVQHETARARRAGVRRPRRVTNDEITSTDTGDAA
jgi:hypothetical protein